jgi:antitoxin HicB
MIAYPVRFIPTADGRVVVTFPDVPEACAVGISEDDALRLALFDLERVLSQYCLAQRPLPTPSQICGAPILTTERFSLP